MRTLLAALLIFLSFGLYSQDCSKCDIDILKEVSQSMDELTYELVFRFTCTIDPSCKNSPEFAQWSNDLLFQIIAKDINLLNLVLHDHGFDKVEVICEEIAHPLKDYNYADLLEKVKNSDAPKDMIHEESKALIIAAKKDGIILEE
jgi:hypothetical protein